MKSRLNSRAHGSNIAPGRDTAPSTARLTSVTLAQLVQDADR